MSGVVWRMIRATALRCSTVLQPSSIASASDRCVGMDTTGGRRGFGAGGYNQGIDVGIHPDVPFEPSQVHTRNESKPQPHPIWRGCRRTRTRCRSGWAPIARTEEGVEVDVHGQRPFSTTGVGSVKPPGGDQLDGFVDIEGHIFTMMVKGNPRCSASSRWAANEPGP